MNEKNTWNDRQRDCPITYADRFLTTMVYLGLIALFFIMANELVNRNADNPEEIKSEIKIERAKMEAAKASLALSESQGAAYRAEFVPKLRELQKAAK